MSDAQQRVEKFTWFIVLSSQHDNAKQTPHTFLRSNSHTLETLILRNSGCEDYMYNLRSTGARVDFERILIEHAIENTSTPHATSIMWCVLIREHVDTVFNLISYTSHFLLHRESRHNSSIHNSLLYSTRICRKIEQWKTYIMSHITRGNPIYATRITAYTHLESVRVTPFGVWNHIGLCDLLLLYETQRWIPFRCLNALSIIRERKSIWFFKSRCWISKRYRPLYEEIRNSCFLYGNIHSTWSVIVEVSVAWE